MAYEGSQGYFLAQQRAWMNCIKCKQTDKKSAQTSWQECFDEFQKGDRKLSWIQNYAGEVVESKLSKEAAVDYSEDIAKNTATGLALGAAVTKVLQEKIAQVEAPTINPPEVNSPSPSTQGRDAKVLRQHDAETGHWSYFAGEMGGKIQWGDLASAKRVTFAESQRLVGEIEQKEGVICAIAPENEGDWSKL
jgi:hypothetical protein